MFCFWFCCPPCNPAAVNVFLLLRLERKLASKSFTTPYSRPDPDAAPVKTPLEMAEEKREALKFLTGYVLTRISWGFLSLNLCQILWLGRRCREEVSAGLNIRTECPFHFLLSVACRGRRWDRNKSTTVWTTFWIMQVSFVVRNKRAMFSPVCACTTHWQQLEHHLCFVFTKRLCVI